MTGKDPHSVDPTEKLSRASEDQESRVHFPVVSHQIIGLPVQSIQGDCSENGKYGAEDSSG